MSVSSDVHCISNIKSQMTPTVDSEREEFRKYLEASGILDVITRILKELYEKEEKPVDPLAYFISSLQAFNYYSHEIAALEDELKASYSATQNLENEMKEAKLVIENLKKENASLKSQLDQAQASSK